MPSPVEYLAAAVGKYLLYTAILSRYNVDMPLYLAVPIEAYRGILSEEIGQIAIRKANMRLIVFDAINEEIIQWIG